MTFKKLWRRTEGLRSPGREEGKKRGGKRRRKGMGNEENFSILKHTDGIMTLFMRLTGVL